MPGSVSSVLHMTNPLAVLSPRCRWTQLASGGSVEVGETLSACRCGADQVEVCADGEWLIVCAKDLA